MAPTYPGVDDTLCVIRNAGQGKSLGCLGLKGLPRGTRFFTELPILTVHKCLTDLKPQDMLTAHASLSKAHKSRFNNLRTLRQVGLPPGHRLTHSQRDIVNKFSGNMHGPDALPLFVQP